MEPPVRRGALAISLVVLTCLVFALLPPASCQHPLSQPYTVGLFPWMHRHSVKHFYRYDAVLSDIPAMSYKFHKPGVKTTGFEPESLCRYSGFQPTDIEAPLKHDPVFQITFQNDILYNTSFWTGPYLFARGNSDYHYHHYWDGTGHVIRSHYANYRKVMRLQQLCLRRTDRGNEFYCGMKMVIMQSTSAAGKTFHAAHESCNRIPGFGLPTPYELASLMLRTRPNFCWTIGWHYRDSWTQVRVRNHVPDPTGSRLHICVGCRIHFRDMTGVKRIDSNGKIYCKSGFVADIPRNTLPVCLHNTYWDMNTIGRCRGVAIVNQELIYYLPLTHKVELIWYRSDSNPCPNTHSGLIFKDYGSDMVRVETAFKTLFYSWGRSSEYIPKPGFPTFFPRSTVAKYAVCRVQCKVDNMHTMQKLDRLTGLVTCKTGYLWQCPTNDCAREDQPRQNPVCHGRNGFKWENLAVCTKLTQPQLATIQPTDLNLVVLVETATTQCRRGFYESCHFNWECAGGQMNIPYKYDVQQNMNLNQPTCRHFQLMAKGPNVEYHMSTSRESSTNAKWACQQNGMHLASELHYTYHGQNYLREVLASKVLWLENSREEINAWHSDSSNNITPCNDTPGICQGLKFHFVCVKYLPNQFLPRGHPHPLDYLANPEKCFGNRRVVNNSKPERCESGCRADPRNLRNVETLDQSTGYVTCKKGYFWLCPTTRCTRKHQPIPKPVCDEKTNFWTNIARCVEAPVLRYGHHLRLTLETASVTCRDPKLEISCERDNTKCAGYINNPVLPDPQLEPYTVCDRMHYRQHYGYGYFGDYAVTYLISNSHMNWYDGTLSMCEKAGYHSLTELQYYYSSLIEAARKDARRVNFPGEFWLASSNGDVRLFNTAQNTLNFANASKWKSERVVCFRNHKPFHPLIDFSRINACRKGYAIERRGRTLEHCKECNVPLENVDTVDLEEGLIKCKTGYLWVCPSGDCSRRGQPPTDAVCDDNHTRINIARCVEMHPMTMIFMNLSKYVDIERETASVRYVRTSTDGSYKYTSDHLYETCPHPIPCAGGPKNIPIKVHETGAPLNLPGFAKFSKVQQFTGGEIYQSSTRETVGMARLACEVNAMSLVQWPLECNVPSTANMASFLNRLQNITEKYWIQDMSGNRTAYDPKSQNVEESSSPDARYSFVCVRYGFNLKLRKQYPPIAVQICWNGTYGTCRAYEYCHNCVPWRYVQSNGIELALSQTNETAEIAERACFDIGNPLLKVNVYLSFRHVLTSAGSFIWLNDTDGNVRAFNTVTHQFSNQPPSEDSRHPFACFANKYDWNTGLVTCRPGYLWTCPHGHNCARAGQPYWRATNPVYAKNFPQCVKASKAVNSYSTLVVETATAICPSGTQPSCLLGIECAGPPRNVPVRLYGDTMWNKPNCVKGGHCVIPHRSNVQTYDMETGQITCQPGYDWHCPIGNCTTSGQPTPAKICHPKTRVWQNVAECRPAAICSIAQRDSAKCSSNQGCLFSQSSGISCMPCPMDTNRYRFDMTSYNHGCLQWFRNNCPLPGFTSDYVLVPVPQQTSTLGQVQKECEYRQFRRVPTPDKCTMEVTKNINSLLGKQSLASFTSYILAIGKTSKRAGTDGLHYETGSSLALVLCATKSVPI